MHAILDPCSAALAFLVFPKLALHQCGRAVTSYTGTVKLSLATAMKLMLGNRSSDPPAHGLRVCAEKTGPARRRKWTKPPH